MATAAVSSGICFGAALAYSGVYRPDVILRQLQFRDSHMLQAFLMASATSTLAVAFTNWSGRTKITARPLSTIFPGYISSYDANAIGGSLVGVGMALTGACPGTILVQVAADLRSALPTLAGALLGGGIFILVRDWYLLYRKDASRKSTLGAPATVASALGITSITVTLAYSALCASLAITLHSMAKASSVGASASLVPLVGGVAIGAAQLVCLLSSRTTLGISTAYEIIGQYLAKPLLPHRQNGQKVNERPNLGPVHFCLGVVAGASALLTLKPPSYMDKAIATSISTASSLLGGMTMVVGARIAGGCTSGHGISGMASQGVSSLVTTAFMFGAGALASLFLR